MDSAARSYESQRMMPVKPFLVLLLLSAAVPALAADPAPTTNQRVDRLEKELRAVQRKVFPGGSPAFFEPEIAPPAAAAPTGTPANAPLNELTGRVNALERSLAELTAKIEEDEHRLTILSQQAAKDRGEFDARLKTLETPPAPAPAAAEETLPPPPARPIRGKPTKTPPASVDAEAPPAVDTPVAKPTSGDPGEDAYMAGYKLWADKKYPEAEAALTAVIKKYPKHKRATYARNLLGRAQLDEGKPATAAQTFLANYQSDPHGERAPDSLFYLGQSLTQLKKTDNACRAFDELQDVYGATMSETIKAKLPAARKAAACK
jgi:TolA-binding protein